MTEIRSHSSSGERPRILLHFLAIFGLPLLLTLYYIKCLSTSSALKAMITFQYSPFHFLKVDLQALGLHFISVARQPCLAIVSLVILIYGTLFHLINLAHP